MRSQLMLTTIGIFLSLDVRVIHDDGHRVALLLPVVSLSALFLRLWTISIYGRRLWNTGIRFYRHFADRLELYRLIAGIGFRSVFCGSINI